MNHITLLKTTKSLITKGGSCAFVIPYEIESFFLKLANTIGLFEYRILHTKDTESALIKRSFLQFKTQKTQSKTSELVLKNKDKTYSKEFIKLTKDFYRDL